MQDVSLRMYRTGDEEEILELRDRLEEIEATDKGDEAHWHHEMHENPAGDPIIPLAFDGEGQLVSHLVMQPRKLNAFGEDLLACQVIDVMTHPDYRGRGMLSRINEMGMEEAREQGCDFFHGFPNANSYPPYVKSYGWQVVRPLMPLQFRPLAPLAGLMPRPLRSMRTRIRLSGLPDMDDRVRPFSRFDERLEGLLERFDREYPIHFKRDARTLNWRYTRVPNRTYHLLELTGEEGPAGFVALRTTVHHHLKLCVIMDLYTTVDARATAGFVETALMRMVHEHGSQLAFSMFLPHCRQYRAVRRAGFHRMPTSLNPYRVAKVGKVVGDEPPVDPEEMFRARNWYVSFGDNDVF